MLNMVGRERGAADPVRPDCGARPSSDASEVASFQAVYRTYFDFVWSTVRRFGVTQEAVDDVVQEVFIVVHSKLDTLERPEALRSWIYSVVRRTVSTYHRAKHTRAALAVQADIDSEVVSQEPTPLARTETNAELQVLQELLAEMDEPKREVFALVELEELSIPEVSELLSIPLNTAYSRLRSARQAFSAALARHEARTSKRGGRD
jgi:RNA polymerase sigma-70 factor, ECF subfamily